MKLKTAIAGLYDKVANPALRADAVAFLRKYSDPARDVTHYACRGRQTETVVSLLEAFGFERDRDFRVDSSSFDPGSNAIRFLNRDRIAKLAGELAGVPETHFDRMYASVAHPDMESVLSAFHDDGEEPAAGATPAGNPDHFVARTLAKSIAIVDGLATASPEDVKAATDGVPNAAKCAEAAISWAKLFERGGGGASPVLLPLPILEAYVRMFVPLFRGDKTPWLFLARTGMAQRVRVARSDESVPTNAFVHAPIAEFPLEGPLRGYFTGTKGALEGIDLGDKAAIVAMCDAPMVFGEGFDDVVTPVRTAMARRPLWLYIQNLYRCAYPFLNSGFRASGMRIAISDRSATWDDGLGYSAATLCGSNPSRAEEGERMTAKYAVILSDREIDMSFSNIAEFVPIVMTPAVASSDGEFTESDASALGRDETAWEWLCMTHAWHQVGSARDRAWRRAEHPAQDDPLELQTFDAYRDWKETVDDGESLAALSRVGFNRSLSATRDSRGEMEFNPVSAFVDGALPLALRLHADGDLPFADWGGDHPELHGSDLIVANVHSGVWTDLSPEIGSEESESVFPSFAGAVALTQAAGVQPDARERVSAWLGRMALDGSTQVKFAQRTKGTERFATVVVETNIDAERYLGAIESRGGRDEFDKLVVRLRRAFCDCVLLRFKNPYCCTDEELGGYPRVVSGHSPLVASCGAWYGLSFRDGSYVGLDCGRCTVAALVDSHGRLVLAFTVAGDDFAYARLAYRWERNLPLATAHVRAKAASVTSNASGVVTIDPGEFGSFDSVVRFMHAEHRSCRSRSADYAGDAGRFPELGEYGPEHREPFGPVAPGTLPDRAWFAHQGMLRTGDALVDPCDE